MNFDTHSLFDGVLLGEDSYLFIGVEDARAEEPNSHGIVWKYKTGKWTSVEINETLVSCTLTDINEYYFVAIAETGKELIIGDNSVDQNIIASGPHSPVSNGPLTQVNCIQGTEIFAVGIARQVYKKKGVDQWIRQDQSCKPDKPEERSRSAFLSIDGFSGTEIYAVGWDGQIWLYNGDAWIQLDSPTNLMLFAVYCSSDGLVYACGQNGTLIKGRNSTWSIIDQDETSEDLRDIVQFDERLFFCSNNLLYSMDSNGIKTEAVSAQIRSFGKLKTDGKYLLSIGLKSVAVYDANSWTALV